MKYLLILAAIGILAYFAYSSTKTPIATTTPKPETKPNTTPEERHSAGAGGNDSGSPILTDGTITEAQRISKINADNAANAAKVEYEKLHPRTVAPVINPVTQAKTPVLPKTIEHSPELTNGTPTMKIVNAKTTPINNLPTFARVPSLMKKSVIPTATVIKDNAGGKVIQRTGLGS